jgi:hypothetical protein
MTQASGAALAREPALLARLAPTRRVPPAFEGLRRRAAEAASQRRRRLQLGAWAASLVAAVGLGWTASATLGPAPVARATPAIPVARPLVVTAAARKPARDTAPAAGRAVPVQHVASEPRPERSSRAVRDSIRAAMLAVLDPAPAVELTSLDSSRSRAVGEFDGMWRTVSWDGARAEAGERLPHIDGLPVLKVQVQAGEPGKSSVMVVAQQLASGQVIQTIEGPAADVSQLLARRSMADVDSVLIRVDSSGQPFNGDHAMAMQLGDRMLAITGALPSDSLRAMIRRLNAEMRSK